MHILKKGNFLPSRLEGGRGIIHGRCVEADIQMPLPLAIQSRTQFNHSSFIFPFLLHRVSLPYMYKIYTYISIRAQRATHCLATRTETNQTSDTSSSVYMRRSMHSCLHQSQSKKRMKRMPFQEENKTIIHTVLQWVAGDTVNIMS